MSRPQKRPLAFLFFTLFMVLVGVGIIIPILPYFAEEMGASATDLGLLFASFSLMQFLAAPFWGRMSDRVGRRPILLLGLVGIGISFILLAVSTSLAMLYAARLIGGFLSSAVMPTAMAYVADATDHNRRARGMGLMGAAMSLGLIFGPAIGGFLGSISPTFPFYVAGALSIVVAGFGYLFLAESRRPQSEGQASEPYRRGQDFLQILTALNSPMGFVLLAGLVSNTALSSLFTALPLYGEMKYGFGPSEMGAFFVVLGIFGALTQGVLVGPVTQRWGEARTALGGMVLSGIGFVVLLLATDFLSALLLSVLIGLGSALIIPALSSLISKRTGEHEQGKVLGLFTSYQSLGRIIGPLMGGLVYDGLGGEFPFIISGLLFLFMALAASRNLQSGLSASAEAGD